MGDMYKDKKGYPRYSDSNRLVHRIVNKTPKGMHTHHKDGNKMNFRKSNLESLTPSEHGRKK